MSNGSVDPKWPRLLSLAVHEFRTPMTVVSGYIRMLLKDRAGPLSDQQRKLLEEAEKSCARLSALLAEMSELSNLEGGTAPFNRSRIDVRALLADTIAALPEVPDREIRVELSTGKGTASLDGDPVRLKTAFTSILNALRRELVTSTELRVCEQVRRTDTQTASWIAVAAPDRVAALHASTPDSLTAFDEWRGGCGLSLAIARRVIEAHGGRLWSPADDLKAGAVAMLPVS
jgi:signal transduction histidine kinase